VKRLALSLRGVVIAAGQRIALLQLPQHTALQWVKESECIDGSQVDSIEAHRITLRHAAATDRFDLKETWKLSLHAQPAKPKRQNSTAKEENAPGSAKTNDKAKPNDKRDR